MKLDEISNFRFGVCKNKPHEKCKDCDSSYEFVIQCLFEGDWNDWQKLQDMPA